LNLPGNVISARGLNQLAHGLQNKVIIIFIFIAPLFIFSSIIQTLTVLDLSGNEIGTEGAKYLANVLEKNTVNTFIF
jgi:hypothetical protein